jgi:hypothetical protein
MRIPRWLLETRVYGAGGGNRFTQDSPVMPDVWFGYGANPGDALDQLLEPQRSSPPALLSQALRKACMRVAGADWRGAALFGRIAYDESYVAASLTLTALVRAALPLSPWWESHAGVIGGLSAASVEKAARDANPERVAGVTEIGVWFLRLVGPLVWAAEQESDEECEHLPPADAYARSLAALLRGLPRPGKRGAKHVPTLWGVNRNRLAKTAIWAGARTIKADAATSLFSLECDHLTWAVLDTGIDATHPAFRKRNAQGKLLAASAKNSRIKATYDFTQIRQILHEHAEEFEVPGRSARKREAELARRLKRGQAIDWGILEPILRVDHGRSYRKPGHPTAPTLRASSPPTGG